uniref:Uncharacterized protein n=1 Tax=Setaria viridis TaxID=4556 RepID=A0A4U6VYQ3_SETVI|nr:hypothetical protein SEVIR_2G300800v2 [Setaria viridis]
MGAYVHAVFFFLSRKQLAAHVFGHVTASQPVMRLTCSIKKERSTA